MRARLKEIKGLLDRGTFKVTLREELPDGANVLTAQLVKVHRGRQDQVKGPLRRRRASCHASLPAVCGASNARCVHKRNPSPQFELDPDQYLLLIRPLPGLCVFGDLWPATLDRHLRRDISTSPMKSDLALYTLMTDGILKYNGWAVITTNRRLRTVNTTSGMSHMGVWQRKCYFDIPRTRAQVSH